MADLYNRKVTLELTDVEVRELTELAARADMTAGELLSAFVHDLCRSEWRNGSDESDRAEDWYDRTGFAYGSMSLAANLVQEEGIGGIITLVDALESQQMYREDPESWKEELEEGGIEPPTVSALCISRLKSQVLERLLYKKVVIDNFVKK